MKLRDKEKGRCANEDKDDEGRESERERKRERRKVETMEEITGEEAPCKPWSREKQVTRVLLKRRHFRFPGRLSRPGRLEKR